MEKTIKIKCRENDNFFNLELVDNRLDEMHVSDCMRQSWIIIGFKDIKRGFKRAGYKIEKIEDNDN